MESCVCFKLQHLLELPSAFHHGPLTCYSWKFGTGTAECLSQQRMVVVCRGSTIFLSSWTYSLSTAWPYRSPNHTSSWELSLSFDTVVVCRFGGGVFCLILAKVLFPILTWQLWIFSHHSCFCCFFCRLSMICVGVQPCSPYTGSDRCSLKWLSRNLSTVPSQRCDPVLVGVQCAADGHVLTNSGILENDMF